MLMHPRSLQTADKKMVVFATHGAEDPERATIPFVMANAVLASDVETVVILQTTGVTLAVKGNARHVRAEAFPPLDELMKNFQDMGGRLLVCVPCIKARGITEDGLVEGTKQVAAGTVVAECVSADSPLIY